VKITDFGLAKLVSEVVDDVSRNSDDEVDCGLSIGSLPWMAPELINQEPPPTPAADIFRSVQFISSYHLKATLNYFDKSLLPCSFHPAKVRLLLFAAP